MMHDLKLINSIDAFVVFGIKLHITIQNLEESFL